MYGVLLSLFGLDERFGDTDTRCREYLGLLIFRYQYFTNLNEMSACGMLSTL
jgi:hypothetical protein